MRYFKLNDLVYSFSDDPEEDAFITSEMVPMTADEIDRHVNPKKYMTMEEKRADYLASLKPLSRRQFKLILLEYNLLDKVMPSIDLIEDPKLKAKVLIEWEDSAAFERTNPTINALFPLMGLKESKVDALWEEGLKL